MRPVSGSTIALLAPFRPPTPAARVSVHRERGWSAAATPPAAAAAAHGLRLPAAVDPQARQLSAPNDRRVTAAARLRPCRGKATSAQTEYSVTAPSEFPAALLPS